MNTSNRVRYVIAVVLMLLVVILLLSACAASPFRLHIVANSNSISDQQVKLTVRDAVLKATRNGIDQCKNAAEAEEYIQDNIGIILTTANNTLEENGFDYEATAQVGKFHFPDKSYKNVCYPEGDYQALRVTLGEGEGENWWCVMFPPLCITDISDIEEVPEDIEYKSLIAEFFEKLFNQ